MTVFDQVELPDPLDYVAHLVHEEKVFAFPDILLHSARSMPLDYIFRTLLQNVKRMSPRT